MSTDHTPAPLPDDYDRSIHTNPDADAWARFYCAHHPDADLATMRGWFANAMMAMHDFLLNKQREHRIAQRYALREQLAEHAHKVWAGWMHWQGKHVDLVPLVVESVEDTRLHFDAVNRWGRQMETPYADLTERERNSDREIAEEYLAIMERSEA